MAPAHDDPKPALPSVASGTGAERIDVAAVRRQAAFVRTLLDHLDEVIPSGGASVGVTDQLIEELIRLACSTLEAAAALTRVTHGSKLQ